ncbi:M24 family metallopeptidase [Micromonospora sp. CPCC 206060]|uniref:M24 family metallopeptidase n=1 Tax=Micromonospora sp. CPCC 206060 TaxID=3122406 RepID=UPI002FF18FE3
MSLSLNERDRRWNALNKAMAEHGIDALVFAANDYRGHKGSLRYVADYNLAHRSGNAVMYHGEEPFLVLPGNLSAARRPTSGWVSDYRFTPTIAQGLVDAFARRPDVDRVGVIGLEHVMKVGEYLALTRSCPDVEFVDFSREFERIRAVKSDEEIAGAEESAYILDQCLARLLEIARPGAVEREIAAEMYKIGHQLGGEDALFLTMYTEGCGPDTAATFGAPRDRVLGTHNVHTFSFEITGPAGYWTELSRMVTFARADAEVERMARAAARGIARGAGGMRPGATPASVQQQVLDAVEAEGATSSYWSGHSLGLDVLEHPMIGLDVVEDGGQSHDGTLEAGFVVTLHPMVKDENAGVSGYMADTFVIDESGSRKLSEYPTGLYRISRGEVFINEY